MATPAMRSTSELSRSDIFSRDHGTGGGASDEAMTTHGEGGTRMKASAPSTGRYVHNSPGAPGPPYPLAQNKVAARSSILRPGTELGDEGAAGHGVLELQAAPSRTESQPGGTQQPCCTSGKLLDSGRDMPTNPAGPSCSMSLVGRASCCGLYDRPSLCPGPNRIFRLPNLV